MNRTLDEVIASSKSPKKMFRGNNSSVRGQRRNRGGNGIYGGGGGHKRSRRNNESLKSIAATTRVLTSMVRQLANSQQFRNGIPSGRGKTNGRRAAMFSRSARQLATVQQQPKKNFESPYAPIGNKLLINNIHYEVSSEDIQELFEECGELLKGEVHYDKSGRSLGVAEIIYKSPASARQAFRKYNGVNLDGMPMKLEIVNPGTSLKAVSKSLTGGQNNGDGASSSNYRERLPMDMNHRKSSSNNINKLSPHHPNRRGHLNQRKNSGGGGRRGGRSPRFANQGRGRLPGRGQPKAGNSRGRVSADQLNKELDAYVGSFYR